MASFFNPERRIMNINEYMQAHKKIVMIRNLEFRHQVPRIVCADGFNMSVQVSEAHYCTPRVNDAEWYTAMEIGYPSEAEPLIMEYAGDKDETVYGYVPVEVIDAVIDKHGGWRD